MISSVARILAVMLGLAPAVASEGGGIRLLPVPVSMIPAGHVISAADLRQRKFQTTPRSVAGVALGAEEIVGLETRRNLSAGRPIPLSALSRPMEVLRGTKVMASYEEDGLSISAQLVALEDGTAGDLITARNADSGAVLRVRVLEGGRLAVQVP